MQFFGLPYISLSYNLGYFFNNPETGFKFSILLSLLTYAVPLVLTQDYIPKGPRDIFTDIFNVISPFTALNNCLTEIVKKDDPSSVFSRIWEKELY